MVTIITYHWIPNLLDLKLVLLARNGECVDCGGYTGSQSSNLSREVYYRGVNNIPGDSDKQYNCGLGTLLVCTSWLVVWFRAALCDVINIKVTEDSMN